MISSYVSPAPIYPNVPQYHPCYTAGPSHVRALTYMQARNFLISDRDTPSVTLIGQVFDTVLDTAPVQTLVRTLDTWGRYMFDVCETSDPDVGKKRLSPAIKVALMSGHGRNLTLTAANCTTEIAIKSLKDDQQVNDTIELVLLEDGRCSNWDKTSICVGVFYNTYFINYTPSYELYNFSDTLGLNEWNYTNSSWSVSCKGQFDLPSTLLLQIEKDLDQVVACQKKNEIILFSILGFALGLPCIGLMTYYGVNRFVREIREDYHHPVKTIPNYGTLTH